MRGAAGDEITSFFRWVSREGFLLLRGLSLSALLCRWLACSSVKRSGLCFPLFSAARSKGRRLRCGGLGSVGVLFRGAIARA